MWQHQARSPPLDSWAAVFDDAAPEQGQGHGVRQPDLHRRRGGVPQGPPAGPEDHQPLRARRQAVPGGRRPAQDSSASTSASTGRTTPRSRRRSPTATRRSARRGRSSPTCSRPTRCRSRPCCPTEGSTGWSDTWMIAVEGQAPELHVQVDELDHLARRCNGAGGRVVRRGAGQREVLRAHGGQGPLQDLPRGRRGRTSTRSRSGRRRRKDCGDDRGATSARTTREWVQAWTDIKG